MNRYESISDEALVEAVQQGDRDAAACLYYRHVDRVHRICYRIVLHPAQVPDCVQDVWLKVFRHLDRFRGPKSFAAWLNSVTAHTAIDYYRQWIKEGERVAMDETIVEARTTDRRPAEEQLDDASMRRQIQEALARISVNQRTAFVLRYFEGMSLPEIARALGCREGTVRTHLCRSLLALRTILAVKPHR